MTAAALAALTEGVNPKGDALAAARIAGIMAAKKTADLIPLCHPLALDAVKIDLTIEDAAIRVVATVKTSGRTGIEMEAMTASCVALLTLYDMGKAVDPAMMIGGVRLLSKTGGQSGAWTPPG